MAGKSKQSWPGEGYHYVDPVFTAYHPGNFSINTDPALIEAYASLSADSGVDVILLGGSTAEWPSLTASERLEILAAWRAAVDKLPASKRPSILFHVGDISIPAAQALSSKAEELGADDTPRAFTCAIDVCQDSQCGCDDKINTVLSAA